MAKRANPEETGGELPLRTARSKSLAVSLADREQPYKFLQQERGSLAIDTLAPRVPWCVEPVDTITWVRLAVARAVDDSLGTTGRKRGLVESRLGLADLLPRLRAEVKNLSTPEAAVLVWEVATAVDRIRERDPAQPTLSPEPLWAFLMAMKGEQEGPPVEGVREWLDEADRLLARGQSGLSGRPGNYG